MPSLPAAIPTLPDPGAASAPRLPGPRPACLPRLALAAALALVWGAPMLWITITAPRMVEIFREFGAPQEPLTATALRLGNALASPLGLVGLVVFLPLTCLAVASLALAPRPARAGKARWQAVTLVLVGSVVGAVALWTAYTAAVWTTMSKISDRLAQQPAPTAPPPNAPAAPAAAP